ncbi:hypothetical protein ACOME3_003745 [Neoechinorhynchus agilis]
MKGSMPLFQRRETAGCVISFKGMNFYFCHQKPESYKDSGQYKGNQDELSKIIGRAAIFSYDRLDANTVLDLLISNEIDDSVTLVIGQQSPQFLQELTGGRIDRTIKTEESVPFILDFTNELKLIRWIYLADEQKVCLVFKYSLTLFDP